MSCIGTFNTPMVHYVTTVTKYWISIVHLENLMCLGWSTDKYVGEWIFKDIDSDKCSRYNQMYEMIYEIGQGGLEGCQLKTYMAILESDV